MPSTQFLAIDLGAESGRVMLGAVSPEGLRLEEIHRFPNTPVRLPTGLYWDSLRLLHEIRHGLGVAGRERHLEIAGIGVDTWGVDFGLLGADGALVDNPRHYRDARNNGMLERTFERVPRERIFAETGLQFMQLNTLYQLHAMKLEGSPALQVAQKLLFMPDLLAYWLTGVAKAELTIASTSQFYDLAKKQWATELFEALGLPPRILPEIVPPGTALGPLLAEVRETTGLGSATVYTTAGHDTAAAVAAVPAVGQGWCYISSGTWSLMGVETAEPVINDQSLALNFTNEVGVEGRIRLLKNIMGMWPLQECRRAWSLAGREYDYPELTRLASEAAPFAAVIDPDAFLEPGQMPRRIAAFCAATGQPEPAQPGPMCRVILESLACRYREVLESLETLTGRPIHTIHIVGGGSRNQLLNQFVADATRRTVVAGPSEATAAGNVLVQAMGAGLLSGLSEIRALVKRSFPVTVFEPQAPDSWEPVYQRFRALKAARAAV